MCCMGGNSWDLLRTTLLNPRGFFFRHDRALGVHALSSKMESRDLSPFYSLSAGRLFRAARSESLCHPLVQKAHALGKTAPRR